MVGRALACGFVERDCRCQGLTDKEGRATNSGGERPDDGGYVPVVEPGPPNLVNRRPGVCMMLHSVPT